MKKKDSPNEEVSLEQAKAEVARLKHRKKYFRKLRSTIFILITAAALASLAATLWMPVLEIYGSSMTPVLEEGNYVLTTKSHNFQCGDIIAFYYNNKILVKRVIAGPGDWVDIDEDGVVYINNEPIDEPYVTDLAYGDTTIELPYQVEDSHWFVLGDYRSISMDSRNAAVGTVADEAIVGKLVCILWPMQDWKLL